MNKSKEATPVKTENDIRQPLKVDSNGQSEDRTSLASLNSDSDYQWTFENLPDGRTDKELDTLRRSASTGRSAKFQASVDSDDSYSSQSTGGSDENSELNMQVGESASNRKEKKKKSVHKLVQMKKMFKKTFSDADATPDCDWTVDWKKTALEENNANLLRKTKSKRNKSVPFNDELQVSCTPILP